MLFVLMLPVVVLVASAYRALQLYAPSNVLAARVRGERPRLRTAVGLIVLSWACALLARVLAHSATTGGPGWLNLGVVIAGWDACKLAFLALVVALRCAHADRRERRPDLQRPGWGPF